MGSGAFLPCHGAGLGGQWVWGSGALGFGTACPGEEEGGTVSLKTTLFCSFFYRKRRRFGQNALFHLNKIWRQNTSTSKSVLNLSFVHLSPQMQF
jgi:hypothetical protein